MGRHHTRQTSDKTTSAVRGFTLIELLVVVAIISLLIAILLPSLRQARETARMTVCMTQMRQLYIMHHMYAQDYKQFIPHKDAYLKDPKGWAGTNGWPNVPDIIESSVFVKRGYMPMQSIGIFLCPSDDGYREDHQELAGFWYQYVRPAIFSYTRNAELQNHVAYPTLNDIKVPHMTCLLAEENETAPMNDGSFYSNQWDIMTRRHNDRCGMSFLDGHVDYVNSDEYNSQTYSWRIRAYLDPARY
ncbi:MAG: prepilin-type N-terminal cleavage/methylation domain-containing protein [Phycisphaera sp.]|nr:prepilin-type N-terminal cleavage/methylation domain-containing protein [Phycisphaera sp.]